MKLPTPAQPLAAFSPSAYASGSSYFWKPRPTSPRVRAGSHEGSEVMIGIAGFTVVIEPHQAAIGLAKNDVDQRGVNDPLPGTSGRGG